MREEPCGSTCMRRRCSAVKVAVCRAGIAKQVGCHTFRLAFATHHLEAGNNNPPVQALTGCKGVETTLIYTRVISDAWATTGQKNDELAGDVRFSCIDHSQPIFP